VIFDDSAKAKVFYMGFKHNGKMYTFNNYFSHIGKVVEVKTDGNDIMVFANDGHFLGIAEPVTRLHREGESYNQQKRGGFK